MNALNFKIGNLILVDGEIEEVHSITINGINAYPVLDGMAEDATDEGIVMNESIGFWEIHGIKITEDWLLKLGFKKTKNPFSNDFSYRRKQFVISLKENTGKGSKYVRISIYNKINGFFNRGNRIYYSDLISSVHELQNIYYTFTKEELNMN